MDDIQSVVSSFRRIRNRGISERFYELLFAASSEIALRFIKTDLVKQRDLLMHGVFSLLEFYQKKAVGVLALNRLATSHNQRHLNVLPGWYDVWVDCWIQALREKDPLFSEALAAQWREALRPGIELMKKGHPTT